MFSVPGKYLINFPQKEHLSGWKERSEKCLPPGYNALPFPPWHNTVPR